jgi:hypothetical protein
MKVKRVVAGEDYKAHHRSMAAFVFVEAVIMSKK